MTNFEAETVNLKGVVLNSYWTAEGNQVPMIQAPSQEALSRSSHFDWDNWRYMKARGMRGYYMSFHCQCGKETKIETPDDVPSSGIVCECGFPLIQFGSYR